VTEHIRGLSQEVKETIDSASKEAKGLQPQNKEQTSKQAEIMTHISKVDRRYRKWQGNHD
jgi:gas vesicle protein